MKITATNTPSVKALGYPKLMIGTLGTIVLMTKESHGAVLQGDNYDTGHVNDDWSMSCFKDYTGTITLENSNDH
jgi:hypothetical protein